MKHNSIGKIIIFLLIAGIMAAVVYSAARLIRFRYPLEYSDIVEKYSEQYDLDPYLVLAVINVESRFRHEAVSPKNARGLMQITGKTGEWIAEKLQIADIRRETLSSTDQYYDGMLVSFNVVSGIWRFGFDARSLQCGKRQCITMA